LKRGFHGFQRANLAVDVGDFRLRDPAHFRPLALWVDAQREQFPDLRQGKPDVLRALDKSDTAYRAVGICPVTGAESRRLRQKSLALVKPIRLYAAIAPEGLEVDLGAFREFTNFQTHRLSNYNPKPGT
jgi:hypothetical protein